MTTEARPRIKITYATLRNDNEELHALYEAGVQEARAGLGGHHRNYIDGRWVDGSAGTFEARSPIDREMLIGTFAKGDRSDTQKAIAAARAAAPGWRHTPWQERLAILRRAAESISERQMRSGPDMAFEVG
jgi:delta 1-pyrroline-5-carboxylate dehydrogenase